MKPTTLQRDKEECVPHQGFDRDPPWPSPFLKGRATFIVHQLWDDGNGSEVDCPCV
jgi:hypothetical protein